MPTTDSRMYFGYVLVSERSGRYYIGSTEDIERRLREHNAGKTPSTRHLGPWRLVYKEEFRTLADVGKREAEIRAWKSRSYMRRALGLSDSSAG